MIKQVVDLANNLNQSQWFPLEKLEQIQEVDLVRLVRHHVAHTPWFKERIKEQGLAPSDLWTLDGLKQYRPFTKRDIQQAGDRFKSDSVPNQYKPVGHVDSSGSTGQPVSMDRTHVNNIFWAAHTLRDHSWFKRDPTGKLAAVRATIKETDVERDNWGPPVALLTKDNGPAIGIPVNWGTYRQLEILERFQPNILVLNGGVLQAMVTIWEREGCKLTELKHIKQIGDTVHEPLRDRVKNLFGLTIEDNYSSSEVGAIAIQCPVSGLYHVMAENLIVEILDKDGNDCKAGEIGRVVVTDLHNLAAPTIRYDLGDYAEVGEACTCGRHLPTLKRILGRERGLFVKPDGSQFWPRGGGRGIKSFKVRQFQMVQHALDDIEYRMVTDDPLTEEQVQEAITAIEAVFEMPGTVRITRYENEIPLTNGKYEESICLIK
jgi:phenylacetate-CoA ligase